MKNVHKIELTEGYDRNMFVCKKFLGSFHMGVRPFTQMPFDRMSFSPTVNFAETRGNILAANTYFHQKYLLLNKGLFFLVLP